MITSQERKHHLQDGAVVKLKVWNATVANLTLMALGSSAPEILLSVSHPANAARRATQLATRASRFEGPPQKRGLRIPTTNTIPPDPACTTS